MHVRNLLLIFLCWLAWGIGETRMEAAEPIGWWKLNETTGSIAYDSSGNGFNATVNLGGGPSIWQGGTGFDSNGCANFTAKQYRPDSKRRMEPYRQPNEYRVLGQSGPESSAGEQLARTVGLRKTPGLTWPQPNWLQLRAHLPRPDGAIDIGKDEESIYWAPGDANAYAGRWNHYVFIKDVNTHTLTLYHNGAKVAERAGQMEPMPDVNNFFVGGQVYPTADWYGKIDDLRVYNCALSQFEILKLLHSNPAMVWNEFPADRASDVPVNITLKWSPGDYAAEANGHDIYFGTNFEDVNSAKPVDLDTDGLVGIGDLNVLADWWLKTPPVDLSPSPNLGSEPIVNLTDFAILAEQWGKQSIYKGRRSTTDFSPGLLDSNTTYYWRVDEVNQASVWKGNVWQFNTKGISYVFNDGPGNIRFLVGNGNIVEMQTLFWVPMKGWSPSASSESWNAANVTFSGGRCASAVDRDNVG